MYFINNAWVFSNIKDKYLTPAGILLEEEAADQVEYADSVLRYADKLEGEKYKLLGDGSVPRADNFLLEATSLYKSNPQFRDSLLVGIMKAAVLKIKTGNKSVEMEEKVKKFYLYITLQIPKAARMVASNLQGLLHRWIQKLNASNRGPCIYFCSKEDAAK